LSKGEFSDGGGWHVDDTWMAATPLTEILCMYYPQDVEEDMGPTMLLPGSHRRLYTPPQTAKLGWIRGQEKVVVKAGTLAVCYPSILHARAAHFSDKQRSMIKYGFEVADPQYGYYLTEAAYQNFRRTELGCSLTKHAEVKDREDALWNSYWKFHGSYTFQDYKHQIGVVGQALRKHLDHEAAN
jgi:ectoine hydroxylase-related dioxygenase (phytanoyl-CoA dioxygenase family)